MKHLNLLLIFFVSILILFSCRPKFDEASWEVNALTPIAQSSLSIQDLLADSMINIAGDSSISLVFQNEIASYGLDSMIQFRDTTLFYSASIQNLELSDQVFTYGISLGELASAPDAGIAGSIIILNNGNLVPIVPIGDPTPLSTGEIDIDASSLFQTLDLDSGILDFEVENGFPFDLTDVIVLMKNHGGSEVILQDTFPLIPSGGSVSGSYELHGQTISGNLIVQVLEMSSPGTGLTPVLIDTSDALVSNLVIRDLVPLSATAIFPEQNLVDKWDRMPMKGLGDIRLSEMKIKSGLLEIEAISTINDSMFFEIYMPGALKDGEPLRMLSTIPPSDGVNASISVFQFPFNDYTLDLRGFGPQEAIMGDLNGNNATDSDTVNTYIQKITGRIDSTGQIVNLALNDSLRFKVRAVNIVGEYGLGYLGKDTVHFGPETIDFEFLNNVTSGSLDLNDVSVSLEVNNGIGADALVTIDELTSTNSTNENTVNLTSSELDNGFLVNPATLTGGTPPYNSTVSAVVLDESNSNIEAFIENLPDQLTYTISIEQNTLINSTPSISEVISNPPNFIYFDGNLSANMNVEIPLHFASNQLTLVDTTEFNLAQQNQDQISSGTFNLIIDNGFPIEAVSSLTLLDEFGTPLLDLVSQETIAAAELDQNGLVNNSTQSIIKFTFNSDDLNAIFEASQLSIQVELNHPSVKIYDRYIIEIQLTADFNYTFQ